MPAIGDWTGARWLQQHSVSSFLGGHPVHGKADNDDNVIDNDENVQDGGADNDDNDENVQEGGRRSAPVNPLLLAQLALRCYR